MSNESRWRRSDFVIDPVSEEPTYAASSTGPMGAAPAIPESPRLLGPDGEPLPTPERPFGFTA